MSTFRDVKKVAKLDICCLSHCVESCLPYVSGKRKPDPEFYLEALRHLKVEPASCIFIDDRKKNVEAAKEVGIIGLHFRSADLLLQDLCLLGLDISPDKSCLKSPST